LVVGDLYQQVGNRSFEVLGRQGLEDVSALVDQKIDEIQSRALIAVHKPMVSGHRLGDSGRLLPELRIVAGIWAS